MSASENVAIVKQLYEVMGQGDRQFIKSLLTENIQWYGLSLTEGVQSQLLSGIVAVTDFLEKSDPVLTMLR
ncbi:hypothetical protein VB715_13830 [Crocosphaera sp. UHCC 0190]|uniref:hypothetical protein n=1 Tax=Crocosphaera sp. UHCC 0190 TaxID=3110246 RepID=UPI002B211033|nr:hypothetical protein [Crocosphaera sp. UHCC 0190]MEA5510848.1 hypothetical protein [Crocosphaera sp. UHCC 0190]